jgi:hypothetical protein
MTPVTLERLDTGREYTAASTSGRDRLRWFFPVVSSVLLVGLLVGFAPTFFLRSVFTASSLPGYLQAHGALLTTWYVLLVAQACLVATRRPHLHRRLGTVAVVVAALIVPLSAYVVVQAAPRLNPSLVQLAVVGDLLSLLLFSGFVTAAVCFRRRPDVHKRLMIAASFSIYGPVLVRFELAYRSPVPPAIVVPLALVTLAVYDVSSRRGLHAATKWIAGVMLAVLALLGGLLATGVAGAIVDALR